MPQVLTPRTPATTAGRSADIVVTGATTIFLYTADGLFPGGMQGRLVRKKGAIYEPVADERGNTQFLTHERREATVYAPGTYAVEFGTLPYAVGVGADS